MQKTGHSGSLASVLVQAGFIARCPLAMISPAKKCAPRLAVGWHGSCDGWTMYSHKTAVRATIRGARCVPGTLVVIRSGGPAALVHDFGTRRE